jgi:hypothetical protein
MSLVEKYEILDKKIHKNEDIENDFQEILKETFDMINKKTEKNEFLNVENEEEKLAVRSMFEYMLELWEEKELEEAKEVGFDMAYLVEDEKIKEMFSFLVLGVYEGLEIDEFFDKYVNDENVYKDYFFVDFKDDIDELIIKYKEKFQEEFGKEAE